jgi:hypothetical protein
MQLIPTFCIAHRPPRLSAHLYDEIIETPKGHDYQALVSVVAHPVLAERAPEVGLMNVCGYRKIVTRKPDLPHNRISEAQCAQMPRAETEPHQGSDFLLCLHDFFAVGRRHRNIKEQWDSCHHRIDLYDCLNLAVAMGVMTHGERRALEAEPALIEGGVAMGVYPGSLVRQIVSVVFPLYQEFAKRYRSRFMRYDPRQRRCIAFLAERVETHFILRELRQRYAKLPNTEVFGCLTSSWDGPWEAGTMQ